jgi:hypothetical protein
MKEHTLDDLRAIRLARETWIEKSADFMESVMERGWDYADSLKRDAMIDSWKQLLTLSKGGAK